MRPHLKVTLRTVAAPAEVSFPYWEDIIRSKRGARERLHPAVDAALDRHRVPVWVTTEYRPQGSEWSEDEIGSGLNRIFRLVLQERSEIPAELIADLRRIPGVERVEAGTVAAADLPDARAAALSRTTDQESRDAILLPEAHLLSRGAPDVVVAVLDTGVSLSHPELRDAVLPGFDFVNILSGAEEFIGDRLDADPVPEDEAGHGSHVAGILAGRGLAMPPGVAPRARVLPVRVLGTMEKDGRRFGAGVIENINNGVKWAVDRGADVINMSLGVRHSGGGLPHEEVVAYARRKGVSIVAASGNDGKPNLYYPGALPGVITVGAVDGEGRVAPFSTYHRRVTVVAPGTDIYSSFLGDRYAFASGTSQASPFVAGVVALMKSMARERRRRLTEAQVLDVLRATSDRVGRELRDLKGGYGRVNARDALRYLEDRLSGAARSAPRKTA
jgi:subtilisin family serine protease